MAIKLRTLGYGLKKDEQNNATATKQNTQNKHLTGTSDTTGNYYAKFVESISRDPVAFAQYVKSNNMVKHPVSSYKDVGTGVIRAATVEQGAIKRALTDAGLFDSPSVFDAGHYDLLSTDYLRGEIPVYQSKVAASKKADDENALLVQQWKETGEKQWLDYAGDANSFKNWLAVGQMEGRNYDDPTDEDMLYWKNLVSGTNYKNVQELTAAEGDGAWDNMVDLWYETDWTNPEMPKYTGMENPHEYKSQTNVLQQQLGDIESELSRRETIEKFERMAEGLPNFEELSQYTGPAAIGPGFTFEKIGKAREYFSDPYYAVNNGLSRIETSAAGLSLNLEPIRQVFEGYSFLTPYERKVYNAFYNSGMKDDAQAYLDALSSDLLARKSTSQDVGFSTLATDEKTAVPMAFASIALGSTEAAVSPVHTLVDAFGNPRGKKDPMYVFNRAEESIRNAQYEWLAENGPFHEMDNFLGTGKNPGQLLYSAVTSAIDSSLKNATGAVGSTIFTVGQGVSGESYKNADAKMTGLERFVRDNVSGLINGLIEQIGINAFFGNGAKSAKQFIAKNIAAETFEELTQYGVEEVADIAIDYVFDHEHEYKSGEEVAQDIATILTTTPLSTGLSTGARAIKVGSASRKTGKAVTNNNALDDVLNVAASMDKASESYAAGQKIKDRVDAGKKVSMGSIGALVSTMNEELGADYGRVISDAASGVVVDRMVELGDDEQTAKAAVGAVMKVASGGRLTNEERQAIMNSKTALQVVEELAGSDSAEEDLRPAVMRSKAEAAAAYQKKADTLTEAVEGKKDAEPSAAEKEADALTAGKKGKDTDSRVTIDSDGKAEKGNVVGFVENESGGLDVKVKTSDGEKVVSVDDVKDASGKGVATLMIMEAGEKSSSTMTAQQASEMLATYEAVGGNAAVFATEYKTAFNAGYDGESIPQARTLSAEATQIAYDAGKRAQTEGESMLARRAETTDSKTTQSGVVSFLGEVSEKSQITGQGAEELLSARMRTLSNSQKDVVQGLKAISKATGVNMVLFESTAEGRAAGIENGSFARGTNTIYLDINAGISTEAGLASAKKAGTLGYAVLRTAAHELTHFIENNSKEGYAALKKAAKEEFTRKGKDWETMVDEKAKIYAERGERLDRHGAEAEVLADACEMMLQDAEAITRLAKKNPTLKDKIAGFIRNFMKRIRNALRTIGAGSKEARALMEMRDGLMQYSEELTRLWGVALEEAVEQTQSSVETTEETIKENAVRDASGLAEDIQESVRSDEDAFPDGTDIDANTDSAYQQYSIRTWGESDYVAKREEAIDRLVNTIGVEREKAAKWIDDVNSIAAIILDNKARLDYIPTAVEGVSAFKSNPEYGGSIDMSTICAKRRLATGTLDAIQMALGDAVLTKDDFLHIREMMRERGHEVACGLCFVESSRKNLSKYTKQFIDQYNANHPDNQVSMTDFNTVDGLERVRLLNQEAYGEYEKFMNKLAQRKPKLFEKRTEYRHEILQKFKKDTTVGVKNLNGGLRLQSFSDFEIVHLIDMMQVITDMASVGLAGQAYTKVPDFAWALGDTGLKINLSLIAKGVDADGNLIFDDVEGMDHNEAKRIRDAYSKNVGTIVVAFTDEQIVAAMKSDFVDFIIPFHRSQWQKNDYKALGLPEGTKDYTMHQNEKQGRKRVKDNYLPNDYWKPNLSGKENAEYYLKKCAADGRTPKFAKFLQNNGNGTYSLKADGSTDGYWKLLIDFKMYDNDGNFSPQNPVQPNFNMAEAKRMLDAYNGIHDSFPVAQDVVDAFVAEYNGSKGGISMDGGRVRIVGSQLSLRLPDDISTREYLADADSNIAETVEQANALTIYKQRIKAYGDAVEAVEKAKAELASTTDREEAIKVRNRIELLQKQQSRAYDQLIAAEDTQHIRELTGKTAEFIQQNLAGKTEADIATMIEEAESEISFLTEQLEGVKGASRQQTEATKEQIRMLKARVTRLRNSATRKILETRQHYQEMFQRNRDRTEVNAQVSKVSNHIKTVVKRLNDRIVNEGDYYNIKNIDVISMSSKTTSELESIVDDSLANIAQLNKKIDDIKASVDERKKTDRKAKQTEAEKQELASLREQKRAEELRLNHAKISMEAAGKSKVSLKPAVHELVKTFIDGFGGLVFDQKQADRLKMVYDKLAIADSDESSFYTEDVSAMIAELSELAKAEEDRKTAPAGALSLLDNARLRLEIYTRVSEIADNIWHMVQMADEIFVDGKKRKFAELGNAAGETLLAKKDYRQLYGKKGWVQEKVFEELIRKGNMIPTYFFESLENDEMKLLFDGIMNAQTGYSRDLLSGQTAMQSAKKRYGYAKWQDQKPISFTTKQGHSFDLTVQQMMWVYATAKREASNELSQTKHLEIGGFRFEGEQRMAEKGKGRYLRATNQAHRLTAEDVSSITARLTEDQKAYADEMVKYLSEDAAEQGNRASMELYGIRKYNEKYYFPFRTASEQRYQKSNAGSTSTTDDARLKHASFTNRLTRGANTTLVMSDFDAVISDHINRMATYANFVSQIEAMNRVLNYKVEEGDGNLTSIRALIERKYGTSALKYVENFLKDMNGGVQSDSRATGALNKMVSAFKRGAVGASLSVAVQQPTAYVKAFAYISPKYFVHLTGEGHKASWDEAMKHSGTAVIKDMGRFDVGLGQTASEWIGKNDESELSLWERAKMYWPSAGNWTTAKTKWSDLMSALPGYMDEVTWTHIWKAVKAEQADLHPGMDTKSDAFLDMCGRRFDDIINRTQVYDSVLAKSDLMRSSSAFHKMATVFKAEPTLTANMIYNACTGKHSIAERVRIISGALASTVLAAAFAAGISAWNDDEDERPAAEKYLDKFSALAIDNLNPAGWLPYISDLSSLIEGYEVDRVDMSVASDIINYGDRFFSKLDEGQKLTWKDYEDFVGTLANLTGVPLKNISRDARRAWNAINTSSGGTTASKIKYTVLENLPYGLYSDTKNAYYQRYVGAATAGNAQKAYNIKDFMTSSKGTSEDSWAQGVRKVLKERVSSGDMTADEAKRFMLDHGLAKDEKSAFEYVDKWTEGDEDYSVYNTAREAVRAGDAASLASEVETLLQNGYEENSVFSQVRSLIKKEYMSGSVSKSQVKSMYTTYASDGFNTQDDNEWYWLFREWDYGAKNNGSTDGYSKYGDFVDAIRTGKNLKSVINEYTSHGVEAKTLSSQITAAFKQQFIDLYKSNKTEAANLQARLLTAYEALGYDRSKKQKDILGWLEN